MDNRHTVGKELNTGLWKDLAYLIRFWLFLSQCLGHNGWGEKEGPGSIAGNQARMGLPLQEVQREVQSVEERDRLVSCNLGQASACPLAYKPLRGVSQG